MPKPSERPDPKALFAPIAAALRSRRRAMGLRQSDVAGRTGNSEPQLARWERCVDVPRGTCLLTWAASLGATLIVTGPDVGPDNAGRGVRPPVTL